MGRVLDTRATSPWGLLAPSAKPGGGWQPPVEGPNRHMLTCGALTAPRHQVNTESIASLKTEENESAIQTPGRDECPDPKRSAHNSAQKGHTAQWRYGQQAFQRGNHIGQGGHEGNRESVSSPSRSVLPANAQQEQSGNPHQASETQVGWEAVPPVDRSTHLGMCGELVPAAGMGQVWRNATEQGLTAAPISSHTS